MAWLTSTLNCTGADMWNLDFLNSQLEYFRRNTGAGRVSVAENARLFATAAHAAAGQKRKYTNAPYITHPAGVVSLLYHHKNDENLIAAAWLHDVVEDTGVPMQVIMDEFGSDVGYLVMGLTKPAKPDGLNREQRNIIDCDFLSKQSSRCKTIKLADICHNISSIEKHDPEFAKTYMLEKRAQLEALEGGCRGLWLYANSMIEEWEAGRHA